MVPIEDGAGWPPEQERSLLILLGLEPQSLGYAAHSVDTVPTELAQLHISG
jgi:hypothetical protein